MVDESKLSYDTVGNNYAVLIYPKGEKDSNGNWIYRNPTTFAIENNTNNPRANFSLIIGKSFGVSDNGKLYASGAEITGKITATTLNLSGCSISASKVKGANDKTLQDELYGSSTGTNLLFYKAGTAIKQAESDTAPTDQSHSNDYFSVSTQGLLTAANAVIYGTVYASEGQIGGFSIENKNLSAGDFELTPEGKAIDVTLPIPILKLVDGKPTLTTRWTLTSYIHHGSSLVFSGNTLFSENLWVKDTLLAQSVYTSSVSSSSSFEIYVKEEKNFSIYSSDAANGAVICCCPAIAHFTLSASYQPVYINSANGVMGYLSSSSIRYKKDISCSISSESDPHRLYELPVVEFVYKEGYLSKSDRLYNKKIIGFIAEDVKNIYPIGSVLDESGNAESWNERHIIPGMLKLIQEQHEQIEVLQNQLSSLISKIL